MAKVTNLKGGPSGKRTMGGRLCTRGFLQTYRDYTAQSESPEPYHLYSALSAMSGAIRRHIYFPFGSTNIYPNLYVVLVSPPGVCRKSSAINTAMRLLRKVHGVNVEANKLTPEALIHSMSGGLFDVQPKDHGKKLTEDERKKLKLEKEAKLLTLESTATLICSEFSVLLGTNSQQNGMLSLLTDFYDCPDEWAYKTVSTGRGIEKLRNIFLNIDAATTPESIGECLNSDAIGGGFTSRVLFVAQSQPRCLIAFPQRTAKEIELEEYLLEDLKHIATLRGPVVQTPGARRWFEHWYEHRDRRSSNLDERFWGYLERKPVHMIKIATLLSVSYDDSLVIEEHHYEVALALLDKLETRMPEAFKSIGPTAKDAERILGQLLQNNNVMTFAELMHSNYRQMSEHDLELVLKSLVSAQLITDVMNGSGKTNRIITSRILPGRKAKP